MLSNIATDSTIIRNLYKIPQYEQRSPEWFEQRRDKLTSSDAATALGINPYQKPFELLFKKCGVGKPFEGNVATLYGQKYEDEAIEKYCQAMGKKNHDFGLISYDSVSREEKVKYPFLAGSTDGIAEDLDDLEGPIVLEVKCPYRRKIKHGLVPEYYMPQVQLNMAILNIDKADFIEYRPDPFELNIVRVQRDREWFDKNIIVLENFWNDVENWRNSNIHNHPELEQYQNPKPKKNTCPIFCRRETPLLFEFK